MTKVHFYLKYSKRKESKLVCKFNYNNKRLQFPTAYNVTVSQWNREKERLTGRGKKAKEVNNVLNYIVLSINKLLSDAELYTNEELKQQLKFICKGTEVNQSFGVKSYMSIDNEKNIIYEDETPKGSTLVDSENTLPFYIDQYIEETSNLISPERVGLYNNVKSLLKLLNLHTVNIKDWSKKDFKYLVDNLLHNNYINSTINQRIKAIETILRSYDPNHSALNYKLLKNPKVNKMSIFVSEFETLINLKNLSKKLEKTRDVFVFETLTGQRISDIKRVNKSEINNNIWSYNNEKTDKLIVINILELARNILEKYNYNLPNRLLEKYNYNLPTITDQNYNKNLKELFKYAKLNRIFNEVKYSGIKRIDNEQPIHNLIATHTARRTFITLSLMSNIPITIIMQATGLSMTTIQTYNVTDKAHIEEYYRQLNS